MSSNKRLLWVDLARASCITLVVVYHVVSKSLEEVSWAPQAVRAAWFAFDEIMLPARIPVFFLVSGLLAAGALGKHWRRVLWKRVLGPYVLYLMWLALHFVFFLFPWPIQTTRLDSALGLVAVFFGFTTIWYLWALPVYFAYTFLTRRLPTALAILPPAILSAVGYAEVLPSGGTSDTVFASLLFFVVGARYRGLFGALSRWSTPVIGLAAAVTFLTVSTTMFVAGMTPLPGVRTALGLLGGFAGVLAFGPLAALRSPPMTAFARLGSQTLPIYVLHLPVLAVMQVIAIELAPSEQLAPALSVLWPILLTTAAIFCCLGAHALLCRTPARGLFQPLPMPSAFRVRQAAGESPQVHPPRDH